jgi:predicted alpha/beta-hydrolase family hydrolase
MSGDAGELDTQFGRLSTLLVRPPEATVLYVMAHGAGAGMHHAFMADMAVRLAGRRVATFRYQFPYMERGSKRPDPGGVCEQVVRDAVVAAQRAAPDLPVIAGGKSMGGRMTSQAQARAPLANVRGLCFLGFPLHPARAPSITRAEHLAKVTVPMLFLSGSRDALAEVDLLKGVLARLGTLGQLHVIDGADHSFARSRRSYRDAAPVGDELANALCDFAARLYNSSQE